MTFDDVERATSGERPRGEFACLGEASATMSTGERKI